MTGEGAVARIGGSDKRGEPDLRASGYLTVRQAAKGLSTSIANIHQMVHREQLALAARLGGRLLFRVGEIARAKAERRSKRNGRPVTPSATPDAGADR